MLVAVRIDDDLLKKVDEAADALHLTRSGFIRMLLASSVDGDIKGFFKQMGEVVSAGRKAKKTKLNNKVLA